MGVQNTSVNYDTYADFVRDKTHVCIEAGSRHDTCADFVRDKTRVHGGGVRTRVLTMARVLISSGTKHVCTDAGL